MKNENVSKIKNIVGKRGAYFYLLIVFGVLQSVFSVALALLIKNLVNAVEFNTGKNYVTLYSGLLFLCVILSFVVSVLFKVFTTKNTVITESKIKTHVFKNFIYSSHQNITKLEKGDLISRLDTDAVKVANVYANLTPNVITVAVHLLGIVVALFILQPIFTLIVVCLGAVAVVVTLLIKKLLVKYYKKSRQDNAKVSSFVSEVSLNSLILKVLGREDYAVSLYSNKLDNYSNSKLNHGYLGAFVSSLTGFMFLVLYAGSVVVGSYGLVNGITTLSFGLVIATLQLIMQLKTPLNSISNYFAVYSEMLVSIERLLSVTCEKFNKTINYNGDFTKLEVDNLSFSYGDKEVLKNVSLLVNKGDKVLIKGESGEGKSTLLKLISGVIDSSCVNAICGNEKLKTTSVKNLISYVAEENMLFSGTVKDNVLLGLNKLDSEVKNALKTCCCDFVFDAPNGLDFMVQEGGSNLSIGQGQRLSIARAVVTGAPILVLDEATSGLDEKTEQQLLSNLNKIEGLTVIFVSHKNCFSKFANVKYVLDDGKLLPFAD